jgi:hypothetical protein
VSIERARQTLGFKGGVTNLAITMMPGEQVIAVYGDRFQVERSFRVTKADLAAYLVHVQSEAKIEVRLKPIYAAAEERSCRPSATLLCPNCAASTPPPRGSGTTQRRDSRSSSAFHLSSGASPSPRTLSPCCRVSCLTPLQVRVRPECDKSAIIPRSSLCVDVAGARHASCGLKF